MKRYNFGNLIKYLALVPVLLLVGSSLFAPLALMAEPPNILLITADDLGYADLGCYGGEIPTPNVDRLAAEGLRFRNAYTYAVCVPTRASLMTGLHPHQALYDEDFERFGKLRPEVTTIADFLQQYNYQTFLSGKWHLGDGPNRPTKRGFDHFFGILSGASNYFKSEDIRPTPVYLEDEQIELNDDFYMTDAITEHAIAFLEEAKTSSQPFFLHISFTAPHFPLHARPEDIARHRNRYLNGWDQLRAKRYERQVKIGLFDGSWALPERDELKTDLKWNSLSEVEQSTWDLRMAVYAAQVEVMDTGIGRVLDALERMGIRERTLVLFLSDNGACASRLFETIDGKKAERIPAGPANSYDAYGLWWANASNTPFRLYKTFLHEGGIATPMIVSWPEAIHRPGGFCDTMVQVTDIPATFLDLARQRGAAEGSHPDQARMEGRSFATALRGDSMNEERTLHWFLWGNRAIRRGDWKLVSRSWRLTESSFGRWRYEPLQHDGRWELYNLKTDRTETHNLAEQHPDLREELAHQYASWAERTRLNSGTPEQ